MLSRQIVCPPHHFMESSRLGKDWKFWAARSTDLLDYCSMDSEPDSVVLRPRVVSDYPSYHVLHHMQRTQSRNRIMHTPCQLQRFNYNAMVPWTPDFVEFVALFLDAHDHKHATDNFFAGKVKSTHRGLWSGVTAQLQQSIVGLQLRDVSIGDRACGFLRCLRTKYNKGAHHSPKYCNNELHAERYCRAIEKSDGGGP